MVAVNLVKNGVNIVISSSRRIVHLNQNSIFFISMIVISIDSERIYIEVTKSIR